VAGDSGFRSLCGETIFLCVEQRASGSVTVLDMRMARELHRAETQPRGNSRACKGDIFCRGADRDPFRHSREHDGNEALRDRAADDAVAEPGGYQQSFLRGARIEERSRTDTSRFRYCLT
jgi:hypothetical protein